MYTTSWCGYCARLKKVLKAEGIAFTEVDIEEDPAAAQIVASVNAMPSAFSTFFRRAQ